MAIQAQLYSENIGFPLCGLQDSCWIENGIGGNGNGGFNHFCSNLQHKPQQPQQLQQKPQMQQLQNQQQSILFENSSYAPIAFKNNIINQRSMDYPQSIAAYVEKQRQEIDHYIRSQNERLILLLQEQRKQQLALLFKKINEEASVLLRQKDDEIANAANKAIELDILLKKLEMENQTWQKLAQENEAMVASLNNTLKQMIEDAESCCDMNIGEEETEQNRGVFFDGKEDNEGNREMTMVCKSCNSRNSCVLFLPCRHLCSCKACETFLDSCPVCRTPKKASIEALIF